MAAPPERDWTDLSANRGGDISSADGGLDPRHVPQVKSFYDRLGFRKVW
jgi:hypothetical protein